MRWEACHVRERPTIVETEAYFLSGGQLYASFASSNVVKSSTTSQIPLVCNGLPYLSCVTLTPNLTGDIAYQHHKSPGKGDWPLHLLCFHSYCDVAGQFLKSLQSSVNAVSCTYYLSLVWNFNCLSSGLFANASNWAGLSVIFDTTRIIFQRSDG
jgi:hypothetical protein